MSKSYKNSQEVRKMWREQKRQQRQGKAQGQQSNSSEFNPLTYDPLNGM